MKAQAAHFEVVVVGAGPSGLMAAIGVAERGRSVLLLEKNRRPGAKILISGGGRCNLTHACDERGIAAAFGLGGRFLRSPLAAFGPAALRAWFHAEGVPTQAEPDGKIFPASNRAADVLDALIRRLTRSGARLALDEPATGIERTADGFLVATPRRTLEAHALVVATGGKSYPGCGTTGDAYRWLAALGHTIHTPCPALVPLRTSDEWVRSLAGISLADAVVRAHDSGDVSILRRPLPPHFHTPPTTRKRGRSGLPPGVLAARRGALLLTHVGLSGPAVMDLSRTVTLHPAPDRLRLAVDLLPNMHADQLDDLLRSGAASDGRKAVAALLPRPLPRRMCETLVAQAGLPSDRRASELSKPERAALVGWIKRAEIRVEGSCGFEQAEVTAGGVDLDEVDSRTMQSKLVPGLYLTGELLDLDGLIGGFNLQAAFSTGRQAGGCA